MTEGLFPRPACTIPHRPSGRAPFAQGGLFSRLTDARRPKAFPVQGKVVPQEPDEVSIYSSLLEDIVSFGPIE